MKAQTQIHYEVTIGQTNNSIGGRFHKKQEALDHCKHLMDTASIESRTNGYGEVFDYFVVKITTTIQAEGEDDSPSTPLSDGAIYNLMTSLKDSWHHFNRETLESSFKNVVGRVWYRIKKHCNPDMDWEAMANETWSDQSYMGSWSMFPEPEEEDNFNEYVTNWKYPRVKKA